MFGSNPYQNIITYALQKFANYFYIFQFNFSVHCAVIRARSEVIRLDWPHDFINGP